MQKRKGGREGEAGDWTVLEWTGEKDTELERYHTRHSVLLVLTTLHVTYTVL